MRGLIGRRLAGCLVVVIALAAAATAEAKDWTKIRVAVEGAYPPFSEVAPDGSLRGFDIDIAKALCAEIKAECDLVQQDWDGLIPALMAKKYDIIVASMSMTDERKKRVAFTDKYYDIGARFVRKEGSGIEITPESLKGKKVGVQRATTHDNYVTDNYGDSVEVVRYGTQDEANLDMVAGRIDLLLADRVALLDGFLKTDSGKGFEFVGPVLRDQKWFGDGAGIALRKEDTDLVGKLNAAIAAIRQNGTYDAIGKKYFDFDIYGG